MHPVLDAPQQVVRGRQVAESLLIGVAFASRGGIVRVQQNAPLSNPDDEGDVALIYRVRDLYLVGPG